MSKPTRIDMSAPDGAAIRATANAGGRLELSDSTRPDVPPLVLDDFLMGLLRAGINGELD